MLTTFQQFCTLITAGTEDDKEDSPDEVVEENQAPEEETDSSAEETVDQSEHTQDESSDDTETGRQTDPDAPPEESQDESVNNEEEVAEDSTVKVVEEAQVAPEPIELPAEPAMPAMEPEETAEETETIEEPFEEQPTESVVSPDEGAEVVEVPVRLGVIDVLYNFVDTFDQSQISNAEHASASSQDFSGGVGKPAIFEHPRIEGDARVEYEVVLPQLESNEGLILHFNIGLRDGIDFDDPLTKPDGVRFAVEVSGERRFEAVSETCRWDEYAIELSEFAGHRLQVAFLTECNGAGNTNYDWALWGNPRVLKLTTVPLPTERDEPHPKMIRGVALGALAPDVNLPLQAVEFAYDEFLPTPQIADEISQRILAQVEGNQIGQDGADIAPDIKEAYCIEILGLYAEQPEPALVALGATSAIVTAGNDFEVQCTIRNNGVVPLTPVHEASVVLNRIKLRRGRHTQTVKNLEPGEETTLVWRIRSFSRPAGIQISASFRYQTPNAEGREKAEKQIEIRPSLPKLSGQVASELHTYNQYEHVITENQNLRAVFVRGNRGFEYYVLSVAKNGGYRQVAVCDSISELRYRDAKGTPKQLRILPTVYRLAGNNEGDSIVCLSGEVKDEEGVNWSYETRFTLSENAKRLRTEYRLVTDEARELIAFNGPILRAGDSAFESNKTFGLFPGLEFLEADETSSSTRDAAPPINNRLVPHPYKVTIPLMVVEHKNVLVGLVWNPLEQWDGEHDMLSAVFASPNWYEKQKNHLMGLFLPPPPDWVKENQAVALWESSDLDDTVGRVREDSPTGGRVQEDSSTGGRVREDSSTGGRVREDSSTGGRVREDPPTGYVLVPDRPITIKSQIIVDGNASVFDAMSHWEEAYGAPEPLEPPRSDVEEQLLSRHGLMETVWDAESGKSRHCVDWAPANAPGFATLLWYDYLATQAEAVKQRVASIAESTISESGPAGLVSSALCHILMWEFPFYFGHVEVGIDHLKTVTQELLETQEDDGSWRFHPTTDRTKTLGEPGDVVLGTCAHKTLMLLKHARITGDQESLAGGLKGLAAMKRFNIPRGAQTWECPLYEPDILAAAYAVGAYVEAYEITKDNRHLERAEYWAKTGLPFLYHWNLDDRPGMRFASIPVFGTTFHTHSWFGVPVQWCGLVFAYYIQHLGLHSDQHPWPQIAEGITTSAMYQQWAEGELKGTYPDGFYGFCTERRGPHLNPEDIMVNLYTLRGLDPDVSTAIIPMQDEATKRIHVSSGAQIESITHNESGQLRFKLRYVQHETSYSIIAGYGVKPSAINVGDETIPVVEVLEESESGWLYREEKDIIFIKYQHPTGEVNFEVLPPDVGRIEPESMPPIDAGEEDEVQPTETKGDEVGTSDAPERQHQEEPM